MKYKVFTQHLTELDQWQPLVSKAPNTNGEAIVFSEPVEYIDHFSTPEEAIQFAVDDLKKGGIKEEDIEIEMPNNEQ